MPADLLLVLHVPGPMADLVQRCTRCGEVLTDYRNAMAHVRPGHPEDAGVQGWEEGHPILRTPDGGFTMRLDAGDKEEYVLCQERSNIQ